MYVNWYDDPTIWSTIVSMAAQDTPTEAMRLYLLGKMYNVSPHTIRGMLSKRGISGTAPRQPGPEPRSNETPEALEDPSPTEPEHDVSPTPDLEADLEREMRDALDATKAEMRLRVHQRRLNELTNDQARYELLLQTVSESVATIAPPDPSYKVPPPVEGAGEDRICAFLLSDTQVGMFVDPLEVGARLGYHQSEFYERFRRWEAGVWSTIDDQARLGTVCSIDIWNLGDVVENMQKRISARINVDIQSTVMQAVVASNTFIETIARTRKRYPHLPIFWDQLSGNHDYVEKPGDGHPYDSWAVIVGEMIRQAFRDDPMVTVTVHTERYAALQYGPLKVLLTHGDGIKGSALLPWYGIDRRVSRWVGFHQTTFDLVCLGHFHNRADWDTSSGTRVIVNGAFFDTSSFGASLGLASPAIQKALILTPSGGITYERDIRLREEKVPATTFEHRSWEALPA